MPDQSQKLPRGAERCFVCPTVVMNGCVTQCGKSECPFKLSPMERVSAKRRLTHGEPVAAAS